jgi:hypothetical protein
MGSFSLQGIKVKGEGLRLLELRVDVLGVVV